MHQTERDLEKNIYIFTTILLCLAICVYFLFAKCFVFVHCKWRAKNVAECVKRAIIKQIIAVEQDKNTATLIDEIDLLFISSFNETKW